jgi:large subunit ribosomal protein L3
MAEAKAQEQEEKTEAAESPKGDASRKGDVGEAPKMARPLILGRKVGMLQMFKEDGSAVAATVIETEQNVVTYVRTKEKDGYAAVQIGFGAVDEKKMSKGERGHLKDLPPLRYLREVRLDDSAGFAAGQKIDVTRFAVGDKVHVTGTSKGKGFQGPVHLHHFTRGPKSHGSDHLRRQGSVGSGTTPGRVLKGLRMARRQGNDRVTVKNLEVLKTDGDRALIVLSGAVPGPRNAIVMVRKA